jgi:hypothetical protein
MPDPFDLDDFDGDEPVPAPAALDEPAQVLARALGRKRSDVLLVLDDDETEALSQALALLNAKSTAVSLSSAGLELRLDLPTMLTAIDPGGRWLGYDPDADEDRYESSSLAGEIVDRSAALLVKRAGRQIETLVADAVTTRALELVEEFVRESLETGTLQEHDVDGRPKGQPRPLLGIIRDAAVNVLDKPTGDGFGRGGRQTMLAKMVDEAVGRAFKAELQAEVDKARDAAKRAVRDQAAAVITETIERATRGL